MTIDDSRPRPALIQQFIVDSQKRDEQLQQAIADLSVKLTQVGGVIQSLIGATNDGIDSLSHAIDMRLVDIEKTLQDIDSTINAPPSEAPRGLPPIVQVDQRVVPSRPS